MKTGIAAVLTSVLPAFAQSNNVQKSQLDALLTRAQKFAEEGSIESLKDLQRLVLRPVQSKHMVDAYVKPDHCAVSPVLPVTCMGIRYVPGLEKTLIDHILEIGSLEAEKIPVAKLCCDSFLPTSWHPSSILNVLGKIGEGTRAGGWRQDSNHSVSWWYPMNIFWVEGGNHSIMQGIVRGEGELVPNSAYDLSALYNYVKFDGEQWISTVTQKPIGTPRYPELGFVFEIGRFLIGVQKSA